MTAAASSLLNIEFHDSLYKNITNKKKRCLTRKTAIADKFSSVLKHKPSCLQSLWKPEQMINYLRKIAISNIIKTRGRELVKFLVKTGFDDATSDLYISNNNDNNIIY